MPAKQVLAFVVDVPDDFTLEELHRYIDQVSTVMLDPSNKFEERTLRRFGARIATVKVTEPAYGDDHHVGAHHGFTS
jgi:hypothetical protein